MVHDEHKFGQVLDLFGQRRRARREARSTYEDVVSRGSSLGFDGRRYPREALNRLRSIVPDVCSAPRATREAKRHPRFGFVPGLALDLIIQDEGGHPWNLRTLEMRWKA